MQIRTLLLGACAVATVGGGAGAQQSGTRVERLPGGNVRVYTAAFDPDRPVLGVSIGAGSARDTLGLLVQQVSDSGPAAKAGITEGSRLVAINGVNLRLDAADAGDDAMWNVVYRRLTRELGKVKAGDEVSLRVWTDGRTRDVRVKTVAARELEGSRVATVTRRNDNRLVLGMSVGGTGSKRDTLGLFVMRVSPDGPAEKAGIVEGDRIAAIDGTDLTVDPADAGDGYAGSAMMNRFRRVQEKLALDRDVELRVVRDGRARTVRVRPVKASDLPGDGGMFFFGDGGFPGNFVMPPMAPRAPGAPMPHIYRFDGGPGTFTYEISPEVRVRVEDTMKRLRELRELQGTSPSRVELRATPRGRITVRPTPTVTTTTVKI
jgi:serine protease Do